MIEKIKTLLSEIEQLKASDANELEAARIRYLSKKRYYLNSYGRFPFSTGRSEA